MKTILEKIELFNKRSIPTEKEIMASWDKSIETPIITIICATFNHEKFIADALKGFLIQHTNFPFEIIVHDDASPDNTASIIKEFSNQYPQIIKPILQKQNLYSQNISRWPFIEKVMTGKYIALCEGDDYWFDENKLQIQYELLQNQGTYAMLTSPYILDNQGEKTINGNNFSHTKKITANELINNDGGPIGQTASFMYEKSLHRKVREIFPNKPVGDLFLQITASVIGVLLYVPQIFSVYRYAVPGSWSQKHFASEDKIAYYELFITEMENTIEASKKNKSFASLDWTPLMNIFYKRQAHFYFEAALSYHKKKDHENYRLTLEKIMSLTTINASYMKFYQARNSKFKTQMIILPYEIKNKLKYILRKTPFYNLLRSIKAIIK